MGNTYVDMDVGTKLLTEGHINVGFGTSREEILLQRWYDADDFKDFLPCLRIDSAPLNGLSQRLFIRKQPPRQFLIDNDHWRHL
jgi:hypothetical protein